MKFLVQRGRSVFLVVGKAHTKQLRRLGSRGRQQQDSSLCSAEGQLPTSLAHEGEVVPFGSGRKKSQMFRGSIEGLLLRLNPKLWHMIVQNLWRIPWPEAQQNLLILGPGDGVPGFGFAKQSVLRITLFSLVLV